MSRKLITVAGLAILLSACAPSPTFYTATAPIANSEAALYKEILVEAASIFVIVVGALVWILVQGRDKGDGKLPQQIFGRTSLIILPVLAIVALDGLDFLLMLRTMNEVKAPPPDARDVNVQVVGHRWWWEFDYPELGIATANELHIPVGTAVQINLKSVDVIHSFWVPQISGKTDVIPGQNNTMWLKGDKVGQFLGQCAEFCGTQHAYMRFKVFVDSQEDFDAWVANQQKPAYQPQTEEEMAGYKTLTTTCAACHSLDPGEMNTDKVGPNLTHLFSRTIFAGGSFPLDDANLRAWLSDTQKMKPGNDMEISLLPKEIDNIIAYLVNLK